MIIPPNVQSFTEVESWLRDLPDQMTGISTRICQTGEPYVEFSEAALARPDDAKTIEAQVAAQMVRRLAKYFDGKTGIIYWRTPFESTVEPGHVVVRFDELGSDVDFQTDRKCVLDRNWIRVACYCRLYRATYAFAGFDFTVTPKPAAA